ncbi:hypothetical protein HDU97_009717 [Phlyctochytrium planicorne]|nr:hypothetical protein HDU97_009717 [Phlyctochytrium planicorne]
MVFPQPLQTLTISSPAPIVYHDLTTTYDLIWGGTLKTPFDPSQLYVSEHSGRIYHPTPESYPIPPPWALTPSGKIKEMLDMDGKPVPSLALIKSSVVQNAFANGLDGEWLEWKGGRYRVRVVRDGGE